MITTRLLSNTTLAACLLGLIGCSSPEVYQKPRANLSSIQRIAVLPFTPPPGMDKEQARGISEGVCDMVATGLMQRGFEVVERARVEEILKERNLTLSESSAGAKLTELGQILGVDALATGSITGWREYNFPRNNGEVGLTLKLYDARSGGTHFSGSGNRTAAVHTGSLNLSHHAQKIVNSLCGRIRR